MSAAATAEDRAALEALKRQLESEQRAAREASERHERELVAQGSGAELDVAPGTGGRGGERDVDACQNWSQGRASAARVGAREPAVWEWSATTLARTGVKACERSSGGGPRPPSTPGRWLYCGPGCRLWLSYASAGVDVRHDGCVRQTRVTAPSPC
jgi:hypothetical protein